MKPTPFEEMEGGGQEGGEGATSGKAAGGVEEKPDPTLGKSLPTTAHDFVDLKEELRQVGQQLVKLEGKIEKVEDDIRLAEERGDPEEKKQLREEKKQLREKEKQLREKEKQLREEKLLLLERQVPGMPNPPPSWT